MPAPKQSANANPAAITPSGAAAVAPDGPLLGPSRIVWLFRVDGRFPLAIGKLFVVRESGSPLHLLQPRRRLAPGRYELMFARYGHRWQVMLSRAGGEGHPDDMLVEGRVPL